LQILRLEVKAGTNGVQGEKRAAGANDSCRVIYLAEVEVYWAKRTI
jgi:hypothetical protein